MIPVIVLISTLLIFVFPATAEPSKAENAIRCAALYLISSSTADGDKELITNFASIQKMYERIYLNFERQRLNRSISLDMISKKKLELVSRLIWNYERDPQSVYDIEMQCNAWRKKIAPYITKRIGNSSDRTFFNSAFYRVPDMPKVPGPEDQRWEKSKLMVDDSFSEWDELAKKSREAYRNAIKSKDYNSHKQPQKKYPPNRSTSQITSNDDNTEEILKTLGSSPVTLQCFSIHDCNFLDESMCQILNTDAKGRMALGTINKQINTIHWQEFYKAKDRSAFIKYWKIIVNSEKVIGAIEVPQTRNGFNSFLLDKSTLRVATNSLLSNNENGKSEQFGELKRFACKIQY